MRVHRPKRKPMFVAALLALSSSFVGLATGNANALSLAAPGTSVHQLARSSVLPPSARPEDTSLTDITRKAALFLTSGSNLAYYPSTPFQILYGAGSNVQPSGAGLTVTGTNSFTVAEETPFYLPLTNATDSPPVIGAFPTTSAQAPSYFFGPSQIGGRDFEITVDGSSTPIGPAYLVGPLTTPPLLDGGGTHIVNLGAFIRPLQPGTHTVAFSGTLSGDAFAAASGVAFVHESFTYTVTVVPE